MSRKRILSVLIFAVVLTISLSSCSSSDKKEEGSKSSAKSNTKSSGSNSKSKFVDDVAAVCESVDQNVFSAFDSGNQNLLNDPQAFEAAIQAGEDELDRIISDLEDIDAPSAYSDDWDTFIEDFSALRDAYPKIADYIQELNTVSSGITGETDPAAIQDAQDRLTEIQTEYEALAEDLSQRSQEISDISERLGIKDCSFK